VSRIDTVSWVRSVELFLGCVDDAALGLFLNCYGETNALIRREPFAALGGFDTNDAGVDSEPWSLFAAFSLAGYRLEAHADVLFARPTRVCAAAGRRVGARAALAADRAGARRAAQLAAAHGAALHGASALCARRRARDAQDRR
jgi:hypothetical protein